MPEAPGVVTSTLDAEYAGKNVETRGRGTASRTPTPRTRRRPATMTYEVFMPQLGLTMEEGSVVSWNKQVGDWVAKGEVLFSVETDKTEMEVESADAGYLTCIRVQLGEKVKVGAVIAFLGTQPGEVPIQGEYIAAEASIDAGATQAAAPAAKLVPDSPESGGAGLAAQTLSAEETPASPRARRLAKELGVDIHAVKPSRGKRIVEEDVQQFYKTLKK